MRVGLIGLGAMGSAMARRLAATGARAAGFDLDPRRLAAAEVEACDDPARLCADRDLVLLSLPHDEAVCAATEIFMRVAPPGAILVDCSTVAPATARALSERLVASGRRLLDAPVSGGPAGAAAGTLAIMVGGEAQTLAQARPVLERLASRIVHVGPAGAGSVAKLVNNAMVAAHLLVAAEALRMARLAGVDADAVLAAINGASGRSAATEVNFPRWILSGAFDSGFTAGLMRKDLALAATLSGSDAPLLAAALWAWRASAAADGDDFNRVAAERFDVP